MAPKALSLNSDQLRKVAKVMYYKGAQGIHAIKFRSEYERAQFLKSCRSLYVDTISLISTTESIITEFENDPRVGPVVYAYGAYVKDAIALAYSGISLYSQRAAYLKQLKGTATKIRELLRQHKSVPLSEAKLAQVVQDVVLMRKQVTDYLAATSKRSSRKLGSTAARVSGLTFNKLVTRWQGRLGYKGRFQKLGIDQKMKVFEKVMESGGVKLAKYAKTTVDVLDKYGTKGLFAITAFTTAVDVYSANPDDRYEAAIKNVVSVGSSFLVGELESLFLEASFALMATGQPPLIALGLALFVADYFLASYVLDFINDKVSPAIVSFMNDHKDGVETVLKVASFNPTVAVAEAVGIPQEWIPRVIKYRPGAYHLYSIMFDKNLDVGPSYYLSPILSLSPAGAIIDYAAGKADALDIAFSVFLFLNPFRDLIEKGVRSLTGTEKNKPEADQVPDYPLSTDGILVRGPGVPNAKVLVLQIASKA